MRIVFDLDGTLVESVPSLAKAGNVLNAELGRPPVDEATYAGFVGHGIRVQVERLLAHGGGVPGGAVEPHLARFMAIYEADPISATRPYPGVREGLRALAAAGHRIGVCTQKPTAPARNLMEALELMPPVESLAAGDSLPGVLKPDPALLAYAAAPLGEEPLVMVGDSETDAATARNAGVPFVLVSWGYPQVPLAEIPHDALIERFEDLPAALARIGG